MPRKIISLVLSFGLLFQQISFAQVTAELNFGNYLSRIGSNIVQDRSRPLHLRYFSYDNINDNFKIILDKGDLKNLKAMELENSTKTLLGYFLVGVTLPDDMFWVNLRPDSEGQIIDPYLEKTDIGKIMLEADLQLKKDTAAMTSPATPEGKEYWDKLYKKAADLYGYDNVTIPTLTRPWIVPGEIIVRESRDSAYVYKAILKVMLEQDYLKDSTTYNFKDERAKALNEYSSQLIRELIIPKLTKEVNSSKKYASLRQVYYSLILSRWFKLRFAGKTGTYASLINTKDLTNLISQGAWSKTDYFNQYKKSFQDGEYNIKESVYTPTGQVIRSYFSGGINVASSAINTQNGIILTNDNADKLGEVVGGKANVNLDRINLNRITSSPVKSDKEDKIKKYLLEGFSTMLINPSVAVEAFTRVIGLNPDDALGYLYRGDSYMELKKYDLALADYNAALETKPGPSLFLNDNGWGYVYLDPKPHAHLGLGRAYYGLAQYEKAVSEFNKAIVEYEAIVKTDSDRGLVNSLAEAYYGRGRAYRWLGQDNKGNTDLEKVKKLNPVLAIFIPGFEEVLKNNKKPTSSPINSISEENPPVLFTGFQDGDDLNNGNNRVDNIFTKEQQARVYQWIEFSNRPYRRIAKIEVAFDRDEQYQYLKDDEKTWDLGRWYYVSIWLVDTDGERIRKIGEADNGDYFSKYSIMSRGQYFHNFIFDPLDYIDAFNPKAGFNPGLLKLIDLSNFNSNKEKISKYWNDIQQEITKDVVRNRIFTLIEQSRLSPVEKSELIDIIKRVSRAASNYFIKSEKDNPLHHSFIVLDIALRIALEEGLRYRDIRKLVVLAILHDLGYGALEDSKGRISSSKIKKMIQEYESTKDSLSQEERNVEEGNIKKAIQDAIDARKEHMAKGIPVARELLTELKSQNIKFDIDEICELVGMHDNPGIAKTYETKEYKPYIQGSAQEFLINKHDTLALIFREADRLWMLSYEGLMKDLVDNLLKGDKPLTVAGQFDNNIAVFTDERKSYDAMGRDYGIFYGNTFIRTKTGYKIFQEYSQSWGKIINGHAKNFSEKQGKDNIQIDTLPLVSTASYRESWTTTTGHIFPDVKDQQKIAQWIRISGEDIKSIRVDIDWEPDWDSERVFEADISVYLVNAKGEQVKKIGQTSQRWIVDEIDSIIGPLENTIFDGEIDGTRGSSPIAQESPQITGGIDFRVLPMAIQPMGSFTSLNFKLPQLSQAELRQINVSLEMQQIKNMVQSGIIPSGQRIKEIVAACIQKKEMNSQVNSLLLCLADIFRLEEENASGSSPELREALAIVDSQS